MVDAFGILRKHKPVAAFGVGGYAAGPMLLATWLGGVPNVIFEPNAEPGFTNKTLARISKRIATGYEVSARAWGAKAVVTGNPVRPEFLAIEPRAPQRPLRLLVTGGSQGALPVNRAFVDAMDALAARKNELSIVHQTGERDYDAVRTAYARHENFGGGGAVFEQYAGAICLGGRDCLPRRGDDGGGTGGGGARRRFLFPLGGRRIVISCEMRKRW